MSCSYVCLTHMSGIHHTERRQVFLSRTYEWVVSNESCHTYEGVMSSKWMSHVTHVKESCRTYERSISHLYVRETHMCDIYRIKMSASVTVTNIWMSHVTHINQSCHTYGLVMSLMWMSHVTHVKESCHTYERSISISSCEKHICVIYTAPKCRRVPQSRTYEWDMPHVWMNHVTHVKESCHIYERSISHSNVWDSHMCDVYYTEMSASVIVTNIWMSHVTHTNDSYHICEEVLSHMSTIHITCVDVRPA